MRLTAVLVAAFIMASIGLQAQVAPEEINIVQNLFGMEKRMVIAEIMVLQPNDSVAFWPLYDEYEVERKEMGKKRINAITSFASKFPAISNEEINELVKDAIEFEEDMTELRGDYYNKIKKATSAMVGAKFFQIESYIESRIQSEIRSALPFIGDFVVKAKKK